MRITRLRTPVVECLTNPASAPPATPTAAPGEDQPTARAGHFKQAHFDPNNAYKYGIQLPYQTLALLWSGLTWCVEYTKEEFFGSIVIICGE